MTDYSPLAITVGYRRHKRRQSVKRWALWGFLMAMGPGVLFAYEPAALLTFNNLSDLTSTSSARTNLGLGTAATKAISDAAKTTVAGVTGTFTSGHIATFADTAGTIQDGGAAPTGTVSSVTCGTGLSGGTFTTTGTCSVTNPYDATSVAITGGTINGTTVGATTRAAVSGTTGNFNGVLTTGSGQVRAVRTVTAAGGITMATTDDILVVNKTIAASSAITLEASPVTGQCHTVKDGKGDANTNNITITPAAGNIDGAANFVMKQNYQSNQICYNGSEWSVTL